IFSAVVRRRHEVDADRAFPEIEIGGSEPAGREHQPVVEGIADAAAQVAGPADIGMVGGGCGGRDQSSGRRATAVVSGATASGSATWIGGLGADAARVGPAEITLDTEDRAVDLPIVAGHHAADDAVRPRIAFSGHAIVVDMCPAPQIAEMAADIE